jgi:hypothetical protein
MELFLFAIPLGLLIGIATKGSLKNLEKAPLNALAFIPVAFIIRFLVNNPDLFTGTSFSFIIPYFPYLNILAYFMFLYFAYRNLHLKSIRLFALGTIFNAIAIFANGGKMPFEIPEAERFGIKNMLVGLAKAGSAHLPSNRSALFWQLGDRIPVPGLRTYKLVSFGDVILFIALIFLIAELMNYNKED